MSRLPEDLQGAPYGAVILAGGRGKRLGGRAKPELVLGGRRLLDRVLDAVAWADPRIVVGPPTTVPEGVRVVRESPPGGGPVAGLAAGLVELGPAPSLVLLLAADLPFLTGEVISVLLGAVVGDGAVLVDGSGRDQLLVGAWRVQALRAALAAVPSTDGAALHRLLAPLDVARVSYPVAPGMPPPWWDCDSQEDLTRAETWA